MRTEFFVIFTIGLLLLASCGPEVDQSSTPDEIAALAQRKLEEGDLQRALELFQTALDRQPSNPGAPLWELSRGEILLSMGNQAEAINVSSAHSSSQDPVIRNRAVLLAAMAQSHSSPGPALVSLAGVNLELLDAYRAEVAVDLCREQLANIRTENLPDYRNTGWFELYTLLELEKRAARAGDTERAVLYGSEIDRLYPGAHEIYGRPEMAGDEAGGGTWIALLLPLTGQGSDFASHVASGARLAFDRYSEMHQNSPELINFDTEGDARRLTELMESLAGNTSCVAVLGPLTSSSTMAAGEIARRAELPLLTPTATSGDVDRIGEPVFRLVVSEGNQAAAVAEYAVRTGGYTRFGIIHPHTAQGTSDAEQFRAVVESMGGEIVSSQGYQPGVTDFRTQINLIKSRSPQAVFLPVSAWDAVQIAPQLRFYNLEVPLFGTSGWDDDLLLRHGGEYVEGAVFSAAFGLSSLYPETARFVYTYRRATGTEPTAIAAQAYDAANILLEAWGSVSAPTRSRIARKLSSMTAHYGASGRCILGGVRETMASWPLMMVRNGEIIGID